MPSPRSAELSAVQAASAPSASSLTQPPAHALHTTQLQAASPTSAAALAATQQAPSASHSLPTLTINTSYYANGPHSSAFRAEMRPAAAGSESVPLTALDDPDLEDFYLLSMGRDG